MRVRLFFLLSLALSCPTIALGADPAVIVPAPESADVAAPAVAPPAQVVEEKPKPAERPKPVEKPKSVEKPRPVVEVTRPPEVTPSKPPEVMPSKPIEPPAPAAMPAPAPADNVTARQGEVSAGYSFGCLALSFAMLIIGIAAGFIGRHLMSRHKLGGMSVRIGTWRGIP